MRTILAIIFMTFATQVSADEIIMDCENTLYKFKKSFFSTDLHIRKDGRWFDLCNQKPDTLIIGDKGAECKIEGEIKHKTLMFGEMTDVISVEQDIILDFIKFQKVNRTYSSIRNTKCLSIN